MTERAAGVAMIAIAGLVTIAVLFAPGVDEATRQFVLLFAGGICYGGWLLAAFQ